MGRITAELPEYVLVATDDDTGEVVGNGFGVPFALGVDSRRELLARGWDSLLLWAFSDLRHGREPDTVSAIEITITPSRLGQGLSGRMLAAMQDNPRRRGFGELVAPLRPNGKHLEPDTPIDTYMRKVGGRLPRGCGCTSARAG